jgi:hypothetical protein
MAVTGFVEVAEATKWTGEVVVVPEVGELTVTPAKDAVARARVVISNRTAFFTGMYSFRARVRCSEERGYGFIYSGGIRILLKLNRI